MDAHAKTPLGANKKGELLYETGTPEQALQHFKNVTGALLADALNIWAELWDQFEGSVTHGVAVSPEAKDGWQPKCGWPEFLEKMWELRFHLNCAKRLSDSKG